MSISPSVSFPSSAKRADSRPVPPAPPGAVTVTVGADPDPDNPGAVVAGLTADPAG